MWSLFGFRSRNKHNIEPEDRFLKSDGKHQSVWIVIDIVQFPDLPPHARLVRQNETWAGYRTISVQALRDLDFYSRLPRSAPAIEP
ncbi:MAG: hypothetical protein ACPGOY_10425 [Rhodospirillaceae bacterium]